MARITYQGRKRKPAYWRSYLSAVLILLAAWISGGKVIPHDKNAEGQ